MSIGVFLKSIYHEIKIVYHINLIILKKIIIIINYLEISIISFIIFHSMYAATIKIDTTITISIIVGLRSNFQDFFLKRS